MHVYSHSATFLSIIFGKIGKCGHRLGLCESFRGGLFRWYPEYFGYLQNLIVMVILEEVYQKSLFRCSADPREEVIYSP